MRLGKVIHKEIHVMLLFRLAQLLTPRLPDALAVSLFFISVPNSISIKLFFLA
jgi:hypothetical protein